MPMVMPLQGGVNQRNRRPRPSQKPGLVLVRKKRIIRPSSKLVSYRRRYLQAKFWRFVREVVKESAGWCRCRLFFVPWRWSWLLFR